jgi:hypothetical protein
VIISELEIRKAILASLSESSFKTDNIEVHVAEEGVNYVKAKLTDNVHGKIKAEFFCDGTEQKYYVTLWKPSKDVGCNISPSREAPVEFIVDNFKHYAQKDLDDIKNIISNKITACSAPKIRHIPPVLPDPSDRSDRPRVMDQLGYPVIVINNAKSKPISSSIFKTLVELESDGSLTQNIIKKIAQMIYDASPEGHGCLVVIEPSTGRPKFINFGLYGPEDGGHSECVEHNFLGSISVRDLGGVPVDLIKKTDAGGEEFYAFKNSREQIKDIFSRSGFPKGISFSEAQITKVDNCKFSSKAIAVAQQERCAYYNILPGTLVMDLFSGASPLAKIYEKYIKGTAFDSELEKTSRSDNCSTFAYKIVSIAKTGTAAAGDRGLTAFPSNLTLAVNRDFNFV